MSVFELTYISTVAPDLDDADVDRIYEQSRLNNAVTGITGALFFNGVNFAQILEGQPEVVRDLFDTIRQDRRHSGVIQISGRERNSRSFDGWSMARLQTDEDMFSSDGMLSKALNAPDDAPETQLVELVAQLKAQALKELANHKPDAHM